MEIEENVRYEVAVPQYGYYLDSMKPHYAPLMSPQMWKWTEMKYHRTKDTRTGEKKTSQSASVPGYIWVEPHPWIESGLAWGRRNINMNIIKAANRSKS